MLATSLILAALAVILAWPAPILLAGAEWPARAPGTASVAWQAIALAGGLSMIGALLTYGLIPFGTDLVSGLRSLAARLLDGTLPAHSEFSQMFALSGAILLGIHLLLNLATTLVKAERLRRRHRQLVALLSNPLPERPGTRLIDHDAPVAYCLPDRMRSVTVLSAGLMTLLDDRQLPAVIAHEQAHAYQRHHLVLLAFHAWRRSLPWFPLAIRAQEAVAILIEMLADDHARRSVPDETLLESIALVAEATAGWSLPDVGPPSVLETPHHPFERNSATAAARIGRLMDRRPPLPLGARLGVIVASTALIAVPTVLLIVPATL